MQELVVVERLFAMVLSGEKTSTIRWRETRIEPGYMIYVCKGDPSRRAKVWVTKCTDIALSQAATYLGREAEWPDATMLEGMREHYPEIELTDRVQIIEHLSPARTLELMSEKQRG
jgi:hypothetical protein